MEALLTHAPVPTVDWGYVDGLTQQMRHTAHFQDFVKYGRSLPPGILEGALVGDAWLPEILAFVVQTPGYVEKRDVALVEALDPLIRLGCRRAEGGLAHDELVLERTRRGLRLRLDLEANGAEVHLGDQLFH